MWHLAAGLLAPALRLNLRRRVRQDKEDPARLGEREGFGAARPGGRLFWFHAASVGEVLSLVPLLEEIARLEPALHLLVTTGTVTSARLLPKRLGASLAGRVIHRYAPLDVPAWVERFLDGWRPDAAALVESELWPNTLAALGKRGVPVSLVNARLSEKSASRWRRYAPSLARQLLGGIALILPRTAEDAGRLALLGGKAIEAPADLKLAASPLPAHPATLAALRTAIAGRRVLLAASTHPGEDEMVMQAQAAIGLPGLLTILAPRHPHRGDGLARLCQGGRLSLGDLPDERPFFVADTIGDMGLLYRVADVAFIGGSLVPHGGQNPLEAAKLLCPALMGPHRGNFTELADALLAAGALREVVDAEALAQSARAVLTDAGVAAAMRQGAQGFTEAASHIPGRLARSLIATLPRMGKAGHT